MSKAYLADLVVAIHFAYVAFVLLGQILILVGLALRWKWVRNFWFRLIHLVMILVVVLETVFNIECPLTTWEHNLRAEGMLHREQGTFIGRLLNEWMFFQGPEWVFSTSYLIFGSLVLGSFLLAPPRVTMPTHSLIALLHAVLGGMFFLFIQPWIGMVILSEGTLWWLVGRRLHHQWPWKDSSWLAIKKSNPGKGEVSQGRI